MISSTIDPKTTALLVMDYQNAAVDMVPTVKDGLLTQTATLLVAARKAGMRVIFVVVSFRPGYPEVSPRNPIFGPLRTSGRFVEGSPGTEIHAAVAPQPGEAIVTKRRVSAFFGTDLDVILRSHGIETLLLAGIVTSGVVLSTVRHAADADYRLLVVEDCCADRDPELHRVLMEKVFARWATVMKAAEIVASLGS